VSQAKTKQLEISNRPARLTQTEDFDSTRAYALELATQIKASLDGQRVGFESAWDSPALSEEMTRGYRR
jgi:hypothetical protein